MNNAQDQAKRLWQNFYDVVDNGEFDAAREIITYCKNVGLDITAVSMKEHLDKMPFNSEPTQD